MSVSINLLPDVMQAKRSDKERRRVVTVAAGIVCGVSLGITALLFVTTQAQNISLGIIQKSINSKQGQLESTPNLESMLTTQEHLTALPGLYSQRFYTTGIFNVLAAFTPKDVFYQSMGLDSSNQLKLSGEAPNYATVTKLVRVFEGAGVSVGAGGSGNKTPVFTNVNLVSATGNSGDKISFSITATVAEGVTHGSR